jgi:phytoene dehydrogenase-like protein
MGSGSASANHRVGSAVVVVGGGHNGLVCAAHLAAAGVPVTVLEQAQRPGGAVSSHSDALPGFQHDTCSGFFPLTLASPAFDGLGIRERVSWANPEIAMAHPFADGTAIVLARDLERTAESLDATAPGAGRGWREVAGPLLARREHVLGAALTPSFPPVRDGARLALWLRRDGLELGRQMLASSATFGREVLGDDRATAWLSGSTIHSDLSPGSAGGAGFAFALHVLAHAVGWGFPRGGAEQLTRALVATVRELGGELRCGSPVESVTIRAGRAAGVRLVSGEDVAAASVVLAVSARRMAALLPRNALPGRLTRRLADWRYGLGTFKVDYALAGPVPWTAPEARQAAVVHVGDTLERLFGSQQEAGAGRVPAEPALVVGQHSLHDDSRAPAGRHTLYLYTRVPQRLDVEPEEVVERIERRLEAFAPGFSRLVLARAVRTPADLERENPSLVGGDILGGSCEPDQLLFFRPAPELFRGRTPLPGLYVAGASVHPGGGVHGVSGAAAARALLADGSRLGRVRRAVGARAARAWRGRPTQSPA